MKQKHKTKPELDNFKINPKTYLTLILIILFCVIILEIIFPNWQEKPKMKNKKNTASLFSKKTNNKQANETGETP